MKRSQLFNIYNKLQGLRYHSDNKKFSYALIKNIKAIEEDINKMNEIIKPNENFMNFDQERIATCQLHAKKDENGEAILNGEEFQINDMDKFNKDLELIKEKYKETLQERQKQINTYNSKLDEEVDFDFVKIGPDDLPDGITPNELEDIYPLLS